MNERGGEVRRLDRPPGDRYAPDASRSGPPSSSGQGRGRRVGAAVAAAFATAVVTFLLAGLDVGPGFLAVAAGGGWLVGLALAAGAAPGKGRDAGRGRAAGAAVLAGSAMALGMTLDALRSLAEGGVLAPWDYAMTRFGPWAIAFVAVAAIAAGVRGR
jgi:hypothetical protein